MTINEKPDKGKYSPNDNGVAFRTFQISSRSSIPSHFYYIASAFVKHQKGYKWTEKKSHINTETSAICARLESIPSHDDPTK